MNIVTLFKMPGENNEQIQILSIEDGKRFSNVLDVLISQKVNEDGLTLSEIFTNKDMTFRFNKILKNTFTEIKEYYEGTSEYGNFFTIPTKRELDKIEDTYEKLKPIIEDKTIQKYFLKSYFYKSNFKTFNIAADNFETNLALMANGNFNEGLDDIEDIANYNDPGNTLTPDQVADARFFDMLVGIPVLSNQIPNRAIFMEELTEVIEDEYFFAPAITKFVDKYYDKLGYNNFYSPDSVYKMLLKAFSGMDLNSFNITADPSDFQNSEIWKAAIIKAPSLLFVYMSLKKLHNKVKIFEKFINNNIEDFDEFFSRYTTTVSLIAHANKLLQFHRVPQFTLDLSKSGEEMFYEKEFAAGYSEKRVNDNLISPVRRQTNAAVRSTIEKIMSSFQSDYIKSLPNLTVINNFNDIVSESIFDTDAHILDKSTGLVHFNPYYIIKRYNKNYFLTRNNLVKKFYSEFGINIPDLNTLNFEDQNTIGDIAIEIYDSLALHSSIILESVQNRANQNGKYSDSVNFIRLAAKKYFLTQPISTYLDISYSSKNYLAEDFMTSRVKGAKKAFIITPLLYNLAVAITSNNNEVESFNVTTVALEKSINENYRSSNLLSFVDALSKVKTIEELPLIVGLEFYDLKKRPYLKYSNIISNLFDEDGKRNRNRVSLSVINEIMYEKVEDSVEYTKAPIIERYYTQIVAAMTDRKYESHIKETGNTHFAWDLSRFTTTRNSQSNLFKASVHIYVDQYLRKAKGEKLTETKPLFDVFSSLIRERGDMKELNKFEKNLVSNIGLLSNSYTIDDIIDKFLTKELLNEITASLTADFIFQSLEIYNMVAPSFSEERIIQIENYYQAYSNKLSGGNMGKLPANINNALINIIYSFVINDFIIAQEESMLFTGSLLEYKNYLKRSKLAVSNGISHDQASGIRKKTNRIGIGLTEYSLFGKKENDENQSEHAYKIAIVKSNSKDVLEVETQLIKEAIIRNGTTAEKLALEKLGLDINTINELIQKKDPDALLLEKYIDNLKPYQGEAVSTDGSARMHLRALKIDYANKNMIDQKVNASDPNNIAISEFFFLQEAWAKHCAISKGDLPGATLTEKEQKVVAEYKSKGSKYHSANVQKHVMQGPTLNTNSIENGVYTKNESPVNDAVFYKAGFAIMLPTEYMDDNPNAPKTANHLLYELMDRENIDFLMDSESVKARKYEALWLDIYDDNNNADLVKISKIYKTSVAQNHSGYVLPNVQLSTKYVKNQLNKDAVKSSAPAGTQRYTQWIMDVENVREEIRNTTDVKQLKILSIKLKEAEDALALRSATAGDITDYQYKSFLLNAGIDISGPKMVIDNTKFVDYLVSNIRNSETIEGTDIMELVNYIRINGRADLDFSKYNKIITGFMFAEFNKAKQNIKLAGAFYTNIPESFVNSGIGRSLNAYRVDNETGSTVHAESIITFDTKLHGPLFNLYQKDTINKTGVNLKMNQKLVKNIENGDVIEKTIVLKGVTFYIVKNDNFNEVLGTFNKHLLLDSFRKEYKTSLEIIHQRIPHSSPNFSVFSIPVKLLHPMNGQVLALPLNLMKSIGFSFNIDNMPSSLKIVSRNGLPLGKEKMIKDKQDRAGKTYYEVTLVNDGVIYTRESYDDNIERLIKKGNELEELQLDIEAIELYDLTVAGRNFLEILVKQGLIPSIEKEVLEVIDFKAILRILKTEKEEIFDENDEPIPNYISTITEYNNYLDKVNNDTNGEIEVDEEFVKEIEALNAAIIVYNNFYNTYNKKLEPINKKLDEIAIIKKFLKEYPGRLQNQYIEIDIERMSQPHNLLMLRHTDNMQFFEDFIKERDALMNIISLEEEKLSVNVQQSALQNLKNMFLIEDRKSLGSFLITATNILPFKNNGDKLNQVFYEVTSTGQNNLKNTMYDVPTMGQREVIILNYLQSDSNTTTVGKVIYPQGLSKFKDGKMEISLYNDTNDGKRESGQKIFSLSASLLLDLLNSDRLNLKLNISAHSKFALISMLSTGTNFMNSQLILKSPIADIFIEQKNIYKTEFKGQNRFHFLYLSQALFTSEYGKALHVVKPFKDRIPKERYSKVTGSHSYSFNYDDIQFDIYTTSAEQRYFFNDRVSMKRVIGKFSEYAKIIDDKYGIQVKQRLLDFNILFNTIEKDIMKNKGPMSLLSKRELLAHLLSEKGAPIVKEFIGKRLYSSQYSIKTHAEFIEMAKYTLSYLTIATLHGEKFYNNYLVKTANGRKVEGFYTLSSIKNDKDSQLFSDIISVNSITAPTTSTAYATTEEISEYVNKVIYPNLYDMPVIFRTKLQSVIDRIPFNNPTKTNAVIASLYEYIYQNYATIGKISFKQLAEAYLIKDFNYTTSFYQSIKNIDDNSIGEIKISDTNFYKALKIDVHLGTKNPMLDYPGASDGVLKFLNADFSMLKLKLSTEPVLKNQEKNVLSEELGKLSNIEYIKKKYTGYSAEGIARATEFIKQVQIMKLLAVFIDAPQKYSQNSITQILPDKFIKDINIKAFKNLNNVLEYKEYDIFFRNFVQAVSDFGAVQINQLDGTLLPKIPGFSRKSPNPHIYYMGKQIQDTPVTPEEIQANTLAVETTNFDVFGLPSVETTC